ncbi:MAG: alpha/beta hydrolase [Lentisphaerae bacterium]|nr:alpha/beta hydrolase [Lentisphaerota bacterium]
MKATAWWTAVLGLSATAAVSQQDGAPRRGAPSIPAPVLGGSAGPAAAPKPEARSELPPGVEVVRDIPYAKAAGRRLRLDLYLPVTQPKPWPVIVWIHGGAWRGGDKTPCDGLPVLEKGIAVASISYRLSGEAVFPAQIEDCKAAVRWLRANGRRRGLDVERIGAWGSSAGGHLAALLGTTGGVKAFDVGANLDQSSRVQAVCNYYGPADLSLMQAHSGPESRLRHDLPDSPESLLIGGRVADHPDKAAAASPVTYATPDDPPFLTVHGTADPLVPIGQARVLDEALRAAGVPSTLIVLDGAGHGGREFQTPVLRAEILRFFERHLRP